MVWNTQEEAEIMGRKREVHEPGPRVLSSHTPHYAELPQYARLQMPLADNDARLRRMAEELRGLATQIDFCASRFDLHMTRRLHLIHLEFKHLNQRWLEETKRSPHYTAKQERLVDQELRKSGKAE